MVFCSVFENGLQRGTCIQLLILAPRFSLRSRSFHAPTLAFIPELACADVEPGILRTAFESCRLEFLHHHPC